MILQGTSGELAKKAVDRVPRQKGPSSSLQAAIVLKELRIPMGVRINPKACCPELSFFPSDRAVRPEGKHRSIPPPAGGRNQCPHVAGRKKCGHSRTVGYFSLQLKSASNGERPTRFIPSDGNPPRHREKLASSRQWH
jgi:hypothetical protein